MHMNAEPGGESRAFSIHVFHERQEVKLRRLLGNSFCQNGHTQNLIFIGLLMQNTLLISLEERPFLLLLLLFFKCNPRGSQNSGKIIKHLWEALRWHQRCKHICTHILHSESTEHYSSNL